MPMTKEERAAEDAKWEEKKQMKQWQQEIAATDAHLPRALEDIIDALDAETKSRIASKTMDRFNAKKAIRARKPQGE